MDPRIRAVSRSLLGGFYRLEVAAAVHASTDGRVLNYLLAAEMDVNRHQVNDELKLLVEQGLLVKLEKQRDGTQPYSRVGSAYWAGCAGLLEELKHRSEEEWAQCRLGNPPRADIRSAS